MTEILSILNLISNGGPIATIAKAILLYKLRIPIFLISLILNLSVHSIKGYISAYKKKGSIPQPKRKGRKRRITEQEKKIILQTAKKHPEEFGLPLSRWTLRRLSETLCKLGVYVSHQTVRRILIKNGIRFKKSKSYIQSPDPLYVVKKEMIYKLKENIPPDTAFIYVDESSKSVKEYPGENWTDKAVLKHSLKQKTKGFFSFFLSKDRDGKMYGIAREGYWNHEKFLEFVSLLAWEYRKSGYTRMILVMDNSSYHRKAEKEIVKIGEAIGIDIMWFYLPKYSPWLNPVEAEWRIFKKLYLPLKEFESKDEFIRLFFRFIDDRMKQRIKIC
jgi:transposase